jgi:hypothetical protein
MVGKEAKAQKGGKAMATRIRQAGARRGVLRTSPMYRVLGNKKKLDLP